jgi:uncharacterized MAPEG superfamily protein
MTTPSFIALSGFIAWALFLLILMEMLRSHLVLKGRVAVTAFTPDNATLSPFMQRLARAHANCVEGLPIFGGLLLLAIATDRHYITDSLAYLFLASRIAQSLFHLWSLSSVAVILRFTAFAVQMVIGAYWAVMILASMMA